jgi:hypothetical protein
MINSLTNILIILLRILSGLTLVIACSIGYIVGITISFLVLMQISVALCSITLLFYDVIRSLIMIMILGIYE